VIQTVGNCQKINQWCNPFLFDVLHSARCSPSVSYPIHFSASFFHKIFFAKANDGKAIASNILPLAEIIRANPRAKKSVAEIIRANPRAKKSIAEIIRANPRAIKSVAEIVRAIPRAIKSVAEIIRATPKYISANANRPYSLDLISDPLSKKVFC
jgi:hypothetical protein